ncbi:MAG: DEAD/DEAH box helicase [Thermoplasmata archaeon]|nr:DEAD/DEAH box helicase [Thermoplasmata archaeon]MCI4333711.1 DEAD/DEAH box helicase [Thermoplasmata archaeon]
METVAHPRLRPGVLEDRRYQAAIAEAAVETNTLAVLPTGLGKTAIALRLIAEQLRRFPTQSVLLLAPTRPLVLQHAESVRKTLLGPSPVVLTGAVSPDARAELLAPPQVVVATPQVIGNDLASGRFPLQTFSLIVFDEAHRARGDYPYVAIARANAEGPNARVFAITASPGSQITAIREVWHNLGIQRFEYRTLTDPDVRPYVHDIGFETLPVAVPSEVQHLGILLRAAAKRQQEALAAMDFLPANVGSKRELLELGTRLHGELARARSRGESPPARIWSAVTHHAAAMKALHAVELAETQGVGAVREFLERQASVRQSPASRGFLGDPDVVEVRRILETLQLEHPKLKAAVRLVTETIARSPEARTIVFTQYRQTAERLVEEFRRAGDSRVRAARFVGQASKDDDVGMSQKDQGQLLEQFRAGTINCLVATSVAEEGLDVPSTDLVVFYEPVPGVVRTIQRRGRTGRVRAGRVVVLVAEGTRDEGLDRASRSKERRMHEMLERVEAELRGSGVPAPPARAVQRQLEEYRAP